MHVVVVAHARHPLAEPFAGGLESLTAHLVAGLATRGHRVSVFAARGSQEIPGVDYLWPERLELSAAAQTDVSMPEAGWMQQHHAHLSLMMHLAQRTDVDVVHTHALHYLPVAMAPLLPAPTVLSLHTPPTPWLESALRAAQGIPGRQPVVTAVSRHTARAWSDLVRPQLVPNGIDTREWRAGPGGPALVWSGRITPEKAPHLAVAIARRAGLPLVLAGPLSDETYARQVLWPLLGDGITYAGHLRTSELASLVGRSAAALVTPDWDEPFGLVAAEALACGTPVLALDRGGLGEVVGEHVGRLVPVQDRAGHPLPETELVRSGAELLGEVLGLSRPLARAHALEHHSVDAMVERFERVYESAARLGRRSLRQPRGAGRAAQRVGRRERALVERTPRPRTVGSLALSEAEAEPGR
ncbi:glycosyltransferase [Serinicoccus chungangensis]|uniref:glycosyltransferase n=1 Tax=Serinicoccus chungangensis TaxID=767452 RepID=UPI0009F91CB9|nr:glycosyltransferase [Serinicoccus chungangensis]